MGRPASVSVYFPDYFFCKIIELTCDPCYPHDGTLREHVRSSSSFLCSTIGAFLFRFVVGRLHLSKAYFRFSRSAGGGSVYMLLIRDKSALLLVVHFIVSVDNKELLGVVHTSPFGAQS